MAEPVKVENLYVCLHTNRCVYRFDDKWVDAANLIEIIAPAEYRPISPFQVNLNGSELIVMQMSNLPGTRFGFIIYQAVNGQLQELTYRVQRYTYISKVNLIKVPATPLHPVPSNLWVNIALLIGKDQKFRFPQGITENIYNQILAGKRDAREPIDFLDQPGTSAQHELISQNLDTVQQLMMKYSLPPDVEESEFMMDEKFRSTLRNDSLNYSVVELDDDDIDDDIRSMLL